MKITALKNIITSGGKTYPLYMAFLKAKDVLDISIVPNFDKSDSDADLAKNIKHMPVKKWQRPLIETKRDTIRNTFNDTGEFMPNPILLSENPFSKKKPEISPKVIHGQTTELWEIEVSVDKDQLWIIDGQHRVFGLGDAKCKQNQNHLPVVILINENDNYTPKDFAKIFAQVTTTAKPLEKLHKEWLEYAFSMDKYASHSAPEWKNSMLTTIDLCCSIDFTDGGTALFPNILHDQIVFNDAHKQDNVRLNCQVLTQIFFDYYYNKNAKFSHLPYALLSDTIQKAIYQLKKTIKNPNDSVFFHVGIKKHVIALKAMIKGWLSYLLNHSNPTTLSTVPDLSEWEKIFKLLAFHNTNWDWSTYVEKGTEWYRMSETLVEVILIEAFRGISIPDGCRDIEDCILGNQAFIEFVLRDPHTGKNTHHKISTPSKRTINAIGSADNIKIIDKSFNNEHLKIVDRKTTSNYPVEFKIDYARKKTIGKLQDIPFTKPSTASRPNTYNSTNSFCLEIKTTLYGGASEVSYITFNI